MINLFRPVVAEEALTRAVKVLLSGYIGQGPVVEQFEESLEPWMGKRPITVNSGTSALELAFRLIDIRGKPVISTPMTCSATNEAIVNEGGQIVWADINPMTGLIDPESIGDRMLELAQTGVSPAAVVTVDWGGQPCDYDEIRAVVRYTPIVEDAAHAIGASYKGRKIGSVADYTAFSFQAIKHLTTVDGGALTVPEGSEARARKLRWFGIDRTTKVKFRGALDISEVGEKWHMNDVAAAIGLGNLTELPGTLSAHRRHAARQHELLDGRFGRTIPGYDHEGSWWMNTILIPYPDQRERFVEYMDEHEVEVSQVHWRNDRLTIFKDVPAPDLPGVDFFAQRMVCLPTRPGASTSFIVRQANDFWEEIGA